MENRDLQQPAANRDPIAGAPGAHLVGVGIGAAAGGITAGAAAGTLAAGPIGAIFGAAVGAVVGGLGGKALANHFDPTVEEQFWRGAYRAKPCYTRGFGFDDDALAYRLGDGAFGRYGDAPFEDFEDDLADNYQRARGKRRLEWDDGRLEWDDAEECNKGGLDSCAAS
jgi:hypothetical protein